MPQSVHQAKIFGIWHNEGRFHNMNVEKDYTSIFNCNIIKVTGPNQAFRCKEQYCRTEEIKNIEDNKSG